MEISEEEVRERFGNKNITYHTIPVIDKEAEFRKYIKMCDCPEIQVLKPIPSNERREDIGSRFLNTTTDLIDILVIDNDTGWWMIGGYGDENGNYIWLPSQDQLQEMIEDGMFTIIYYSVDRRVREGEPYEIELYLDHDYAEFTASTMEQLLLKAVMKLKYNKVWNNDKWEVS